MTFYPEWVDSEMLLYIRDGNSCNFGDVCIWFSLVKNTYFFIFSCGIDVRFVVTEMLDGNGEETIHFSYESEDCEGGDVTTYLCSIRANGFDTDAGGAKPLN
jgi:hypothetical protein